MFFALAAEERFDRALLADKNADLVALYLAIQTDVDPLIERLRKYSDTHLRKSEEKRREHFYKVRALSTAKMSNVERGARLVFLNKTCFNGLWRVNAAGLFNVPFGTYAKPRILNAEVLRSAHVALAKATIRVADFSDITKELVAGDVVYFDPPYVPLSKTASFTAYSSDAFGADAQARLADDLISLKERQVFAMLSNASTVSSRALYATRGFHVTTIRAKRSINSDRTKRGDVEELVVTNFPARESAHALPLHRAPDPRSSASTADLGATE